MIGTVFIPNPSVQTLHLVRPSPSCTLVPTLTYIQGNLTYDLAVEGEHIGISNLYDAVVKPGDNYLPMRSEVNQTKVLSYVGDTVDGKLPVEISNGISFYDGVNLTYYSAALKANFMVVPLALF